MQAWAELNYAPDMQGVILIDCWEYADMPAVHDWKKARIENFYSILVDNLKQWNITHVVNAMTHGTANKISDHIRLNLLDRVNHSNIESYKDFKALCGDLSNTVSRWYVAGQSWNLCVHNNDIGLNNLARDMPLGIKFFADIRSFLMENGMAVHHEEFLADQHTWNLYRHDGMYRLEGKNA